MDPCSLCDGTGGIPETDHEGEETGLMVPCPACGGCGEIQKDRDEPDVLRVES